MKYQHELLEVAVDGSIGGQVRVDEVVMECTRGREVVARAVIQLLIRRGQLGGDIHAVPSIQGHRGGRGKLIRRRGRYQGSGLKVAIERGGVNRDVKTL